MPIRKHDATVVLEVLGAFGIFALLSISVMLYLLLGEMKNGHAHMNHSAHAVESAADDKKISVQDLSPELVTEINGSFRSISSNLDQILFLLGKSLDKNFTEEELKALQEEYVQLVAEAQAAAQQQAPAEGQGAPAPANQ